MVFDEKRRDSTWRHRLARCARALKNDLGAVAIACRDRRVRLPVRLLALLVVAYALSPIDLIPDAIPVLGYLDDVIVVPLGIALVLRLLPPPLLAEFRARAAGAQMRHSVAIGVVLVAGTWGAILALAVVLAARR